MSHVVLITMLSESSKSHLVSKRRRPCRSEGASLSDASTRVIDANGHVSPSSIPAATVRPKRRSLVTTTVSGWSIILATVTILYLYKHSTTGSSTLLRQGQPWGSPNKGVAIDSMIGSSNSNSSNRTPTNRPDHHLVYHETAAHSGTRSDNRSHTLHDKTKLVSHRSVNANATATATMATAAVNAATAAASTYWTPLRLPRPLSEQTEPGWAAICAVVKDEELYIDDWIDYHLALGFEHVYLSDNHANYTLRSWYQKRLQREAKAAAGTVDAATDTSATSSSQTAARVHVRQRIVSKTSKKGKQQIMYEECLDHLRTLPFPPKWVLVIDGDEYLVIGDVDRYPNAVSFLTEHVPQGSLQIDWIVMGSSYELHYRKDQPVTQRFQYAVDATVLEATKAVAVLNHVAGWHVHAAVHKKGYTARGVGADAVVLGQGAKQAWHVKNGNRSIAALYHYKYKSYDEFNHKVCVRGRVNGLQNRCPVPGETGTVHDDRAWRAFQRLVPRYQDVAVVEEEALLAGPSPQRPLPLAPTEATTTALCTIAVHGDDRYLREWTDYHLALGFAPIYIFDTHPKFPVSAAQSKWYNDKWDESTPSPPGTTENSTNNVTSQPSRGRLVRLIRRVLPDRAGVAGEEIIYRECLKELRYLAQPPRYVMALDVSEFMVVRHWERYPNITSFLADHLPSGSLQISRVIMGSANQTVYKAAGPVTQRFQFAIGDGLSRYPQAKPVAVLNHIDGLAKHHAINKAGYEQIAIGGRRTATVNGDPCCVQDRNVSVAAVYHYRYKSKEEFHGQQCRGHGPRFARTREQCRRRNNDALVEPGTMFDDSAWRALIRLLPSYSHQ